VVAEQGVDGAPGEGGLALETTEQVEDRAAVRPAPRWRSPACWAKAAAEGGSSARDDPHARTVAIK
jgi:hypothetical protein